MNNDAIQILREVLDHWDYPGHTCPDWVAVWGGTWSTGSHKRGNLKNYDVGRFAREAIVQAVKCGLDEVSLIRMTLPGYDREAANKSRMVLAQLEARIEAAPVKSQEAPADNEGEAMGRLLAAADENHIRIIAIADRPELTVNEKLKAISAIDSRFYGKQSRELATLLDVSPSAITKSKWWKFDRVRHRR